MYIYFLRDEGRLRYNSNRTLKARSTKSKFVWKNKHAVTAKKMLRWRTRLAKMKLIITLL